MGCALSLDSCHSTTVVMAVPFRPPPVPVPLLVLLLVPPATEAEGRVLAPVDAEEAAETWRAEVSEPSVCMQEEEARVPIG